MPMMFLALLCLGYWYYLVQSTADLPLRVAIFFGSNGRATGWLTRTDDLHLMEAIGIGLPVVLAAVGMVFCLLSLIGAGLRRLGGSSLSAEHPPTGPFIFRYLLWLGCWVVGFAFAVQYFIAQANSSLPATMPVTSFLAVVVSFCAVVVVWCSKLAATLRDPRSFVS